VIGEFSMMEILHDGWDLIHIRSLFGSVNCWEKMYYKIYEFQKHPPYAFFHLTATDPAAGISNQARDISSR
jgi:hypothetical protein